MNVKLIPEAQMLSDERNLLRNRLDQFYGTVSDYIAFESVSDQTECWIHIEKEIQRRYSENIDIKIRVLEIGAGKSGFGEWLKKRQLRNKIHWTAQDVTAMNESWLTSQADHTIYGDVSEIPAVKHFDIIFSTYVLEHVTNPKEHLNFLYSRLAEAGKIFIFCPRYDMPGYLCPSTLHLSLYTRLIFAAKSMFIRSRSIFTRQPAFLIQTDLAAFHQPFFLDADAVHWVSLIDLKLWAKSKGCKFKIIKYGKPKPGSKDWFVKRLLTCAIEIQK